ncbi:uncharacterized protein N7496_009347 [Penicillium cataractarum]|uniref:Uncharacterized protein n=1 Tax=Penicillium cataractarum TaxID=2100454 RepID=A0A9W9RRD6_9EURO|nr:uncharacterized protein N7496_009347 [Penicillium cataractarum]KAJ5363634.1 hypothetical protein N7496_009347 [Penicillium cataractarum]
MEPYKDTGPLDCNGEIDTTSIQGKTAIITGGRSQITPFHVLAFVIIADINEAGGVELASKLQRTKFVKCNVTQWSDQLKMFKEAIEFSLKKRVDIVVANAGISGVDSVFAFEDQEELEEPALKIVNINLIGVFYTIKLALHCFRRQHAAQLQPMQDTLLVLQGSMGGYLEAAATLEYCASKFALRGLMRCLRRTSWMHGTRVNYIAPGFIKTNLMIDEVAHTLASSEIFLFIHHLHFQ